MKRILVLALSLLSLYGYSQTVNVGVRGGLSIPNVVGGGDNPLSKGYSSRFAGTGGVFAELGMNDLLSLRLGIEYSGQGGNRNGVQAMSSNQLISSIADIPEVPAEVLGLIGGIVPPIFYADVKNTTKFDYLMIPLSLQVGKDLGGSWKSWRVYAGAGPFVSFLLSAKQVSKGKSKLYADATMSETKTLLNNIQPKIEAIKASENVTPEMAGALELLLTNALGGEPEEFGTTDIKNDLRKVNAGIQGDLGLSYQCNRNRFFLEVGGNYGFVRLQKDASNGSNHIGSATITVGYAYRLGN
ncbi:hypothetical protein EZS27_031108 [termite gut metagenome]|uniref:Outer membrane protein beta-barrel domain-containing protein n=1 Tax=termite gut metagenome TaxID=433724 RepID=A0A5J4QD08_9ZZZZ